MEFLVLMWFFSAIACAVVASVKGKSILLWGFLGLIFGFFAFLAIAFSSVENKGASSENGMNPYDKDVVARPQPNLRKSKLCPFCAEDIKFEAIICKHCGSDIPTKTGRTTKEDLQSPSNFPSASDLPIIDVIDSQGARVLK